MQRCFPRVVRLEKLSRDEVATIKGGENPLSDVVRQSQTVDRVKDGALRIEAEKRDGLSFVNVQALAYDSFGVVGAVQLAGSLAQTGD